MEQNLFGNKQILVTGASGLVGVHLVMQLAREGCNVTAFVRNELSKQKAYTLFALYNFTHTDTISWQYGDITNYIDVYEAMKHIDYVFHCAGFVSFNTADYQTLYDINVLGTKHIVDAALERGITKLCHVSSVAAIGKSKTSDSIDESCEFDITKHTGAYHLTKYCGEMEVWRGIAEGLDAVIVNPSVIIGAGDWNSSSSALFGTVAKGMKYYTTGSTGYISVHDVVQCMIALMQADISGQRYILSAQTIDFRTLFTAIAHSLGVVPPSKPIKPWQLQLVARILQMVTRKPKITTHTAQTAFSHSHYDNTKITETLHYSFRDVLEEIERIGGIYRGKHKN